VAPKVAQYVCRFGGPFDGFEGISMTGHAEVLSALAEVDPEAAAGQIERCLYDVEDLSEVEGDVRRHLVWALEKIAFHPDGFEDGAGWVVGGGGDFDVDGDEGAGLDGLEVEAGETLALGPVRVDLKSPDRRSAAFAGLQHPGHIRDRRHPGAVVRGERLRSWAAYTACECRIILYKHPLDLLIGDQSFFDCAATPAPFSPMVSCQ